MPELPDIEVFSRNLKNIFNGSKLLKIKVINGKKLVDKPKDLSKSFAGGMLTDIFRSGKEMRFQFDNGNILGMHLMLTGDIFLFEKKNERKSTIVEFYFDNGKNLALTDRMKNARVKLNPGNKEGVDALDKKLNFKYLKKLLNRKAKIKSILLNQDLIRGIGNGYSDEILWESKISPFSIANAIPDEKIKELATTIKRVLKRATNRIFKNHPGLIQGEIKLYHRIHTKLKEKSPTGAPIKIEQKGMMKTYYTDEQVVYGGSK